MDLFISSFLLCVLVALFSDLTNCSYILKTTKLSWTAAKAACEALGTELYEQSEIGQWVDLNDQVSLPSNSSFWIALSWSSAEGEFRWGDNSLLTTNYWSENQPDNTTGKNCVTQSTVDGLWSTDQCTEEHNYVCQPGPSTPVPENTPYPRMQAKRDNHAVMVEGLVKGFACAGGLILLVALIMHLPCCRNWVNKKEREVNSWQEHMHSYKQRERLQDGETIGQY